MCRQAGLDLAEPLFDTMVAAYLANPGRNEYNLDALARDYFDHRMIPIEGLLGEKRTDRTMDQCPIDQVAEYSVEDAVVTWRLKERLQRELAEKGLATLAEDVEMPLVPVLASMEERGVAIDTAVLGEISADLGRRLAGLEQKIYEAAGRPFLINSPQQLAQILFEELSLKPLKKTAKGAPPLDGRRRPGGTRPPPPAAEADPGVSAAREAQGNVCRCPAAARQPRDGPRPHVVQPDGNGHGPPQFLGPESPEHPDPDGGRAPGSPRVRPRPSRLGPAGRRLLADRAADARPLFRRSRICAARSPRTATFTRSSPRRSTACWSRW